MKVSEWMTLTGRQQHALTVAMLVRQELEDFHAAHLGNPEMKQLNQLTRFAIYDAIELIETMNGDARKEAQYRYLVSSVPDYWEIPGRDDRPGTART